MLSGRIDDYGRALVPVEVRHPDVERGLVVDAWVDTAFTGELLLTRAQLRGLDLPRAAAVEGGFADGSRAMFDTFSCLLDWFGRRRPTEAVIGGGNFALIGVHLLEDCDLVISYPRRTITVSLGSEQVVPG